LSGWTLCRPRICRAKLALTLAAAAGIATSALSQVSPGNLVFFGDRAVKESIASTAPIAQVSGGANFAAALRQDGSMAAWGSEQFGQCDVLSGLTGITQISAGDFHTLVLLANGTVKAFGSNNAGQTNVPAGLTGVVQVSAGWSYSAAVKSDGTVVMWGAGAGGFLAPPAGLNNVVQVACGYEAVIALKKDGSVVAWGMNGHGELNVPATVVNAVQISFGYLHGAALLSNGTVICWGENGNGQSTPPSNLPAIKEIAMGATHSLALTTAGAVVGWGSNGSGETNVPTVGTFAHIGAGSYASYAIDSSGKVMGWGDSTYGQTSTPNFGNIAKVAAGSNHLLLLANDGTVQAWGDNRQAQCQAPSAPGVVFTDVTAGTMHSALTANPLANKYLFGSNAYNQLSITANATTMDHFWAFGVTTYGHLKNGGVVAWGDDSYSQRELPANVNYLQITGGNLGALGLKPDGTLAAVGYPGDNLNTVPAGATGITQIASGNTHNLALKSDGTVLAWGANGNAINVPPGLSNVVGIAAGDNHSVALLSDGSVTAWGDNLFGQIASPPGLIGMAQIAAGSNYTVCVPRVSLSVAPYQVSGGQTATGTVTIPSPAPSGGLTVTLSSSDGSATVPSAVVVAAGSTYATFPITTTNPAATKQPVISAAFGSLVQSSLLTVTPSAFSMVTSYPSIVSGSTLPLTLTVTLTHPAPAGGAVVSLASSDSSVTVPMSLTVSAGQQTKQITLTHSRVHVATPVTITASYSGTTQTSVVTTMPFAVKAFSMTPATIVSQGTSTALVYLNANPLTPVDITLTSSNNSVIPGPITLTVPVNGYSATGPVVANAVSSNMPVNMTASVDGSSLVRPMLVSPAFTLSTSATTFIGGSTTAVTVTVKLAAPAPAGGASITLTSPDPAVSFAGPVTFTSGQTSQSIPILHAAVSTQKSIPISATYGGTTGSIFVTLQPFQITNLVFVPPTTIGGAGAFLTAQLNGTPIQPVSFTMASSNTAAVAGGSILTVPANSSQGTVKIPTFQVTTATTVKLSTTFNGVNSSVNMTVYPAIASVISRASGVRGAGAITFDVKLATVSPVGGITLSLGTSNCQSQTTTVTVPAGKTGTQITVYADDVSADTFGSLTVTYGSQSVKVTFKIVPNGVASLVVTPTTFAGTSSTVVTATATLVAPVAYDVYVNASSSNSAYASIPSLITIPAGQSSGSVTISHSKASRGTYVNITASHVGTSKSVKVLVD